RQPTGGKDHSPGCGQEPDAGRSRARRQEPDDRPFLGSHQGCRAADRVRALRQLRAHLYGARSRARLPEVKDELVAEIKNAITEFYGDNPKQSPDYGRVINRRNFDRLAALLDSGTVAAGGEADPDELYIAPTVLVDVPVDSPIMQEEVFGPILPVLEIDSVEAVIDWVNDHPRPLGLYVFTEDDDVAERILEATN